LPVAVVVVSDATASGRTSATNCPQHARRLIEPAGAAPHDLDVTPSLHLQVAVYRCEFLVDLRTA
jgi:hypothetical protein